MTKGNGIEIKGKTRGKISPVSGGVAKTITGGTSTKGVTSANMKKYGRNIARVKNQLGQQ